ncbi:nucleotidyltransferase family protein [Microbacterium paludicola]|uniref:nucleotidyltransferase family protein n=1 Tax=Microbacterium paludicola TaxID=300019 RepID=UPI0031E2B1F5
MTPAAPAVCGIVLAAGAGTRFGGPKALARTPDGTPWIARAVDALRAGGCDDVLVVLGAGEGEAAALVPPGAREVVADDWAEGVSASLRAGIAAARRREPDAVVILPVDTPDTPPEAVARVLAAALDAPRAALVQATYAGRPGHPVLLGADHLDAVAASVSGDRGARPYLAAHDAHQVECADLWSGSDVDHR